MIFADGVQVAGFSTSSYLLVMNLMAWERDEAVLWRRARVCPDGVFVGECVGTDGIEYQSTAAVGMACVEAVTSVLGHVCDWLCTAGRARARGEPLRSGRTGPTARILKTTILRLSGENEQSSRHQAARRVSVSYCDPIHVLEHSQQAYTLVTPTYI